MRIGNKLVPLLCGAMLIGACEDRRRGEKNDLDRARDDAAEKIRDAKEDLKDAEKKTAEKIEEAEKKIREKAADVGTDVKTDRASFRASIKKDLVEVDDELAELRDEARTATGQPKRDI